jgi:hypothetical protein
MVSKINRLRTTLPRVTIPAVVAATAYLLVSILLGLLSEKVSCDSFSGSQCGVSFLLLFAPIVALLATLIAGAVLLKRQGDGHPWAISFLGLAVTVTVVVALQSYSAIFSQIFILLPLLLVAFVVTFAFFDWVLNINKVNVWIPLGVVFILIVYGVYHAVTTPAWKPTASGFSRQVDQNNFRILVPPINSRFPQPLSVCGEAGQGPCSTDFSQGVTIDFSLGPQKGFTLYEYKYTGPENPLQDCSHLYKNDHPDMISDCRLVKTLSSGTKIYAMTDYIDGYFIVRNGTLAFLSIITDTLDENESYDFLDSLSAEDGQTLFKVLHRQNPQEF